MIVFLSLLNLMMHEPFLSSISTSGQPGSGATIQSELSFQTLLFEHSFCNHSALNLASRCFGHDVGQEDL